MCSSRDRSQRSTRANNRQPNSAIQEIARRRIAKQTSQASLAAHQTPHDTMALDSEVDQQQRSRQPTAAALAQRDSMAAACDRAGPALVDLTQGSDSGISSPAEATDVLRGDTRENAIALEDDLSDDALGPGHPALVAQQQQHQVEPRRLNTLRRAGSPRLGSSGVSRTVQREPADADSASIAGLLSGFASLQVSRSTPPGSTPQPRTNLAAAAALPLPRGAVSSLAAAAALPLPGTSTATLSGRHSPPASSTGFIDLSSSRDGPTCSAEDGSTDLPEQSTDSSVRTGGRRTLKQPDSSISTPPGVPGSCSSGSDRSDGDAEQGKDTDGRSFQAVHDSPPEGEALGEPYRLGDAGEFRLEADVAGMLYTYQLEGVAWLYRLHTLQRGGILADDMGLGKTMQCAAFLAGMVRSRLVRRAMVLAPKTLLGQWAAELRRCGLGGRVFEYHGNSAADRDVALNSVFQRRGVLLTSYGMVLHNAEALAAPPRWLRSDEGDGALWDFMFLDEGHKVKNAKTKLVQALRTVPAGVRVILSGTPIQNNLGEMHALYDFACEGLLGDARHFKEYYSRPIETGNDRHAVERMRQVAAGRAAELRATIAPFFLRREKGSVQRIRARSAGKAADAAAPEVMPHKNDLIIWLRMQPLQQRLYEAFLESKDVKKALNQSQSALSAITVLKKICDHPALLSARAASIIAQKGSPPDRQPRSRGTSFSDLVDPDASDEDADEADAHMAVSTDEEEEEELMVEIHRTDVQSSCKTRFVMELLTQLVAQGHRTLVFSQSRVMLDILQLAITAANWAFLRLDGSITSAADRAALVARFQRDASIPICLLTSQVGGLGLTLHAADRVILLDPSWNPASDNQSVDRAYRIGQTRDVVVYRLITCGTVEEKIYRRQVFKGGLSRAGTRDEEQLRYFSYVELRDLFSLKAEEVGASRTQADLSARHAAQRRTTPALDAHLAQLPRLPNYVGFSDHDLLFTRPNEHAGAAEPGPQPDAASQHKGQAQPPARRRAAGWGGAGDLSSVLERSLTLQPGSSQQADRQPRAVAAVLKACQDATRRSQERWISNAASKQQPGRQGSGDSGLRRSPEDPKARLTKARLLLADAALVANLPDRGRKLREQVAELERQVQRGQSSSQVAVGQ